MSPTLTDSTDLGPESVATADGPAEGQPNEAGAPGAATESASPAEGSDAAASLEFGRNLTRLREARGLSHNKLAALADIAADSIRDYELGKYRPKQPKLWGLAQALDVMPIMLGPGSTRGGDPPVPAELLMRKKGGRALRLQHLVGLLAAEGTVSAFATLVGMQAEDVYAVASTEGQIGEPQLEPFLAALPQVRRSWLMGGDGEVLQPVAAQPPAAAPVAEVAADAPPVAERPAFSLSQPSAPLPGALPSVAPLSVQPLAVAPTLGAGTAMYVPLGGGLVAEVDAVLIGGAGAVTGFRLLAGAGGLQALTTPDHLARLFQALSSVLDQRVSE